MRPHAKTKLARTMRRNANAPEAAAWLALRSLREQGFPVRRQHPVGRFIVDFAVVKARLVIEVDGGVHALPGAAEKDAARQKEIEALGWRVLRVAPDIALSPDHLLALVQRELGL